LGIVYQGRLLTKHAPSTYAATTPHIQPDAPVMLQPATRARRA